MLRKRAQKKIIHPKHKSRINKNSRFSILNVVILVFLACALIIGLVAVQNAQVLFSKASAPVVQLRFPTPATIASYRIKSGYNYKLLPTNGCIQNSIISPAPTSKWNPNADCFVTCKINNYSPVTSYLKPANNASQKCISTYFDKVISTPTPIKNVPTISPLTMQILGPETSGEYIGDAHLDFYMGATKKYYAFLSAFAGDKTTACDDPAFKNVNIGAKTLISNAIPDLFIQSNRSSSGVTISLVFQGKSQNIFTLGPNANHINIIFSNTNIPDLKKVACLQD